nr:unnamed protein product [Digitaria exilis]
MAAMMQSPRRRICRALRVLLVVALALAALLALLTSTTTPTALPPPPPQRTTSTHQQHRHTLRAVQEEVITSSTPTAAHDDDEDDAVLLPDWEVLVLLRPGAPAPATTTSWCVFPGSGAASPARSLGRMPTSGRHAYTCAMPVPERRHNKPFFRAPTLRVMTTPTPSSSSETPSSSSSSSETPSSSSETPPREGREMLRWRSGRLAYDAAALRDTGDVLVFAKGVNPRQGVNRNASDVRCVYYRRSDGVVASLPAATSAQQVFRCPPPPPGTATTGKGILRVTLAVAGGEPIPSMATYTPPPPPPEEKAAVVCACTMVRDVAKFLREWVVYHSAIGVDRFVLYDNGSQDELEGQVRQLVTAGGFDVSMHIWPWPKTQEAGFSYAAAAHRGSCQWMAFVDVDEFIFSQAWAHDQSKPSKSMEMVLAGVEADVGQVTLGCKDFGPSGHTKHPPEGVTQGYTCRRRAEERHKSLVRLDALEPSLINSIHHFQVRPQFRWQRLTKAQVNHYKYQAWDEFKLKFRRRVSSYVADWTEPLNHGSRDRTPGLGLQAVEPPGWPHSFCEVEDAMLADVTRRWFGVL